MGGWMDVRRHCLRQRAGARGLGMGGEGSDGRCGAPAGGPWVGVWGLLLLLLLLWPRAPRMMRLGLGLGLWPGLVLDWDWADGSSSTGQPNDHAERADGRPCCRGAALFGPGRDRIAPLDRGAGPHPTAIAIPAPALMMLCPGCPCACHTQQQLTITTTTPQSTAQPFPTPRRRMSRRPRARHTQQQLTITTTTPQSINQGYKLFVGNLSFRTQSAALRDAFEPFGRIVFSTVIENRETGQSR